MSAKLPFRPEQSGYGVKHATPIMSVKLAGGKSRNRADVAGAPHVISATWLLNEQDYLTFMDFMIVSTGRGALPFLVDLVIDTQFATQYIATLIPDSWETNQVDGLSYHISMDLEVDEVELFTGGLFFISANVIKTATPITFSTIFQVGGSIQLCGAQINNGVNTPVNLDGIYTINSFPTGNSIALNSPNVINPDWNLIAAYPGSQTPTVTPASVIAVPT